MKREDRRVAITSRGPDEYCEMDESFGRAYWFLIYDEKEKRWESINNSRIRESPGGAGVAAAEVIAGAAVTVVVTGETGPKAYRALSESGILVYLGTGGMVREIYQAYALGNLTRSFAPNSRCNPFCLVNGGMKADQNLSWFQPLERESILRRR